MFNTSLRKKRAVGIVLAVLLLALFLAFSRFPKLDTVRGDLDAVTAPQVECFQGFCIEAESESTFLSRWWDFSVTYLRLVTAGMVFAFLVAGLTEAFLFPQSSRSLFSTGGVWKGTLKGLAVGPVLTLCSACIVPIAASFWRRGAGIGGTLATVQGSSTLNLPALVMVALVFSPMLGGSRIVLSVVGVLLIGPLVALVVGERKRASVDVSEAIESPERDVSPWSEALIDGFRDWAKSSLGYLVRMGPIMVLAGFAGGLVIQWINAEAVTAYLGNDVGGIAIAATFGILVNVPLLFEIPLVALLLLLGMGTAPAATLLFTIAAGGPITFWGLARHMPRRAVVTFAAATWTVGMVGGVSFLVLDALTPGTEIGLRASVASASVGENALDTTTARVAPQAPDTGDFDPSSSAPRIPYSIASRGASVQPAPSIAFEALSPTSPVTPFTNIARHALKNDADYWSDRVWNYRPGVVAFDYDRDGDLDFYVTAELGVPGFLYRNEGDGTFANVAAAAGVAAVESNSTGAVACDLNNDGYQDLYVGARGVAGKRLDYRSALGKDDPARQLRQAVKDRLFVNNGDGAFTEITDSAFGDAVNLRSAASIACADVDGDGWLDIYVGNLITEDFLAFTRSSHPGHYNVLYRNNGDLTFQEVAESAGVRGPQITMRDPEGRTLVFEDAETGEEYEGYDPNAMDANGNRVGDPTGRTHAVLFFDYDDDRDPDLWVASDGDRLHVFRNDSLPGKPRFTPVARAMGIDKVGNWMGFAVGDYDGDADLDVFVTNVGYHTLTRPPQEQPGGDCSYHARFTWGTCFHFLLRNDGTGEVAGLGTLGLYQDVASSAAVLPSPIMPPDSLDPNNIHPSWQVPTGLAAYDFGFGATFFDFDNDGDQDLYWLGSEVDRGQGPNGHVYPAAGRMLRRDGRGLYEDITVRAHLLDISRVDYSSLDPKDPEANATAQRIRIKLHENGKGLAHGDLNGDGYVDLIGTNSSGAVTGDSPWIEEAQGPLFVWLNGGGENHWITLRLKGRKTADGSGSNADGIGARVYVKTVADSQEEPLIQVQEVRAGSSYLSMDSIDLEFGVGTALSVEEITIFWPSGREQILRDISVDQVIVIIEPER